MQFGDHAQIRIVEAHEQRSCYDVPLSRVSIFNDDGSSEPSGTCPCASSCLHDVPVPPLPDELHEPVLRSHFPQEPPVLLPETQWFPWKTLMELLWRMTTFILSLDYLRR